jgi:amidohydrolase
MHKPKEIRLERLNRIKTKLKRNIDDIQKEVIRLSDRIHANPETAFNEVKASAWLSDYLEQNGFQVTRGIAGLKTSFHATIRNGDGPTLAFLSEYDALPKIGHGCGHNLIATASVAAAVGLAKSIDELSGTIAVFGTPAEEGGGGKITILDRGFFQGVDSILMIHPSDETIIHRGALGRFLLNVVFLGRSAHASSRPTQGLNALDAMISFFVSVGLLRQQLRDDARVHGVITNGGTVPNIIPDRTEALFSIRSLSKIYNGQLVEKVMNCARGAAIATGTGVEFNIHPLVYEPKKQNFILGELFLANLAAFDVGEIQVHKDPSAGGIGSSDIGNVSQIVPTLNPYIKIGDAPTHSLGFAEAAISDFAARRMIVAAKAMAMTAIDLLMIPDKMTAVWDEFKKNKEI